MPTASPTSRPTIVGPDNCPRCRIEARVAELEAEIAAHQHSLDCGETFVRFGAERRAHCTLRWPRGAVPALGRARYDLEHSEGHHCRPHRCDFGPNCGSYDGQLR